MAGAPASDPAVALRFAPTPRLALFLLLAGLPAAVAGYLWLAASLTLLLTLTAAVDLFRSHRRIELVRQLPPAFRLEVDNAVRLAVRAAGAGPPLALALRDTLPLEFDLTGACPQLRLTADQWVDAQYLVRPRRRGRYQIGPLHLRYHSPLGLWQRLGTWPPPAAARVYPNLKLVRQWELAMRQGQDIDGPKRSRVRGTGTEFESLREYQPGDPYRTVNWPASARAGRLMTNVYQVDRMKPIILLIDAGRLMAPRVQGLVKLDHAMNAALLLATVAAEKGDACGCLLFGGEVRTYLPPRKGRTQVLSIVEATYDKLPEQVEPDYGRMIGWLRGKQKKRSLVVFFTDVVDPDISHGLVQHLSALAAQHLVLLVCLSDPQLLALAEQMPGDSRDLYQKAAALEVLADRRATKAELQRRGVLVIDVPPEQFGTALVNQYLTIKEQGRL